MVHVVRHAERVDDARGVGGHPHLGVPRALAHQPPERRQQVRVQAGLRFVQDHQARRARREQRRNPKEVAQRAVRQLGLRERPQQAVLREGQAEPPAFRHHIDAGAGKRIRHGLVERRRIADLHDGAPSGRQVASVVGEHRRAHAHLRLPGRRAAVGAEVVVEAPRTDALAQQEGFRRKTRIRKAGKHAVERGQVLLDHLPAAAVVAGAHHRPAPIHGGAALVPQAAAPDHFALDLRIFAEHGARHRRRQAEVDGVGEVLAGEAEAQMHAPAARPALQRALALFHAAGKPLRSRPQRGLDAAFRGEGFDGRAKRGLRQQPQTAVEIGLAAAVRAGDHVERAEGQRQLFQRTVVGDR